VTSSNIRFIRIEVSGTAVIYVLMFHCVNYSLVIPFTSGLRTIPHHPCLCFNGLLSFRQIIVSSHGGNLYCSWIAVFGKVNVSEQAITCAARDRSLRKVTLESPGHPCALSYFGGDALYYVSTLSLEATVRQPCLTRIYVCGHDDFGTRCQVANG
jgi:hypothetical protein